MNKPVIAIFLKSSLATLEEEKLIEKYHNYPTVICNAETYDSDCTLLIDCICGEIPEDLKYLPDPEKAIELWKQGKTEQAEQFGGEPPVPPSEPPVDTKIIEGFGEPPVPPSDMKGKK